MSDDDAAVDRLHDDMRRQLRDALGLPDERRFTTRAWVARFVAALARMAKR